MRELGRAPDLVIETPVLLVEIGVEHVPGEIVRIAEALVIAVGPLQGLAVLVDLGVSNTVRRGRAEGLEVVTKAKILDGHKSIEKRVGQQPMNPGEPKA